MGILRSHGIFNAFAALNATLLADTWAPMNCDLDSSLPEWIIEYPETMTVFSELGLDVSCGGKSLGYVCRHQGLSPQDVLGRLQEIVIKDDSSPTQDERDSF